MKKRFDVDVRGGKVKWQLFSPGGRILFTVNGKEFIREIPENGKAFIEFESPAEFEIEIVDAPENCFAAFDRRRDYGRSELNGEVLSGEWVMTFFY